MTLRHQIKITPDFVLLNKRTRQEFYFEHFGMMDNPEYSSKAIHKIEMYQNYLLVEKKELLMQQMMLLSLDCLQII